MYDQELIDFSVCMFSSVFSLISCVRTWLRTCIGEMCLLFLRTFFGDGVFSFVGWDQRTCARGGIADAYMFYFPIDFFKFVVWRTWLQFRAMVDRDSSPERSFYKGVGHHGIFRLRKLESHTACRH